MTPLVLINNPQNPLGPRLDEVLRKRLPGGSVVNLAGFDQAENALARRSADLLVVALSPSPDLAFAMVAKVRKRISGPVFVVGQTTDSRLILRALNQGADHYIDENDLEAGFDAALQRLTQPQEAPAGPNGRLISILGASGGCGGSTLAVNLATVLARDAQGCALIDLKPGAGDLAALLDLKPSHSIADLCENAARMDRAMFQGALVPHPSGVHLLSPPQRYEKIRAVTPAGVQKTLNLSRQVFPHTVVDVEDCFHEEQVIALRDADAVVLVFHLDFTSLRNARRILEYFEQIQVLGDRVRIVANKHGQAKQLAPSEAEGVLGRKIAWYIPDDPKTINGANNTGVPVVLKAATSKVAQSIMQMAEALRAGPAPRLPAAAAPSRSWLASVF